MWVAVGKLVVVMADDLVHVGYRCGHWLEITDYTNCPREKIDVGR
jgi:hypothetical protein